MPRFDRYMLSQLLTLFGFFSLVLVLVYWINRAVTLFDQIIADGQSAWVFLELTALSLPTIIKVVLPISAFAAGVYVTNRMASESELTVVQATGYSAWRLARPVLVFGLIVCALMLVLSHVLLPASQSRLIERQAEISRSLTARLLTEGQFLSPSAGVTVYIREITPEGELRDVFLSDSRREDLHVGYTASRAFLVRAENGPQLVMVDGLAQTLDRSTGRLLTTRFEDFAYDVSSLVPNVDNRRRNQRELDTATLYRADAATQEETRATPARLIEEANSRTSQALLALLAPLLGFAALLQGGFSRFGLWKQILLAIALMVVVETVRSYGTELARDDLRSWSFSFLAPAFGALLIALLLHAATRPYLFKKRPEPGGAPA